MKNACDSCKYAKNKGEGVYCVKYGIVIYKERIHCISWERTEKDAEVRKQKDRGGWDHL